MRTARSAFSKAGGVVLSERAFYAYQSTLNSYFFKVFLDRPLNHLAELFEWMGARRSFRRPQDEEASVCRPGAIAGFLGALRE